MDEIVLRTRDGGYVAAVQDPVALMMIAQGNPPDVLCWGQRFFAHRKDTEYREVLVWFIARSEPNEPTTPLN